MSFDCINYYFQFNVLTFPAKSFFYYHLPYTVPSQTTTCVRWQSSDSDMFTYIVAHTGSEAVKCPDSFDDSGTV